jgi:hypothetical protein
MKLNELNELNGEFQLKKGGIYSNSIKNLSTFLDSITPFSSNISSNLLKLKLKGCSIFFDKKMMSSPPSPLS